MITCLHIIHCILVYTVYHTYYIHEPVYIYTEQLSLSHVHMLHPYSDLSALLVLSSTLLHLPLLMAGCGAGAEQGSGLSEQELIAHAHIYIYSRRSEERAHIVELSCIYTRIHIYIIIRDIIIPMVVIVAQHSCQCGGGRHAGRWGRFILMYVQVVS